MKKFQYFIGIIFFIAISLPCSYFFHLLQQAPEFTIESHSLRISVLSFIGSSVIIFFLLLGLWLLYSKLISKLFQVSYPKVLWQDFWSWTPLAFLGLSPFALSHYFTSDDFISRLKLFLLALIAAILYLKLANFYLRWKENQTMLPNLFQKFSLLPLKKKLVLLFLIALVLYNTGSAFMLCSNINFSGDEPHYLLITHSLLKDGDINLENNYAEKEYRQFMPPYVTIKPHIAPGTNNKYSFHSPGVSILLLPFYALGSIFKGKVFYFIIRLGMSIFGALLGIQLFLYARSEWKNEKLALILWGLFSFTSPVIFYSIHVYPEIIAALFSLAIFRILRYSKSLSPFTLIILGALLSSMIWFHALKYIFIMGPLFVFSVWSLFKQHKLRWNAFYFFAPAIFLGLVYFFFQFKLYGSFSLSSISLLGAMAFSESMEYLKSIVFDIPLRYRLETLAGYFFDQRDGLLFYSPVYFFAFIGFFQMLKRKPKDFLLLLFITAPYVLNSAFLTQRAAYAPQARPLVAVFWGLAIFLGYFLACNAKKIFSYIFAIAVFLSYLFVILLLKNPLALYQPTTFGEIDRA
ncbi:MAG: hypothetical protein U9O50_01470, partial [Acidobacteriota bacterium]|nr:hypothetical protein [Acidobacteriota bacterium]